MRTIVTLIIIAMVGFFAYRFFSGNSTIPVNLGNRTEIITVLAGSELRDLEPYLGEIQRKTGVQLEFEYIGTLDGVERIISGGNYDTAWFSHGKYLTLLDQGSILSQERIMLSPVVLGVKESQARAFGWVNNPDLTWRDIAAKAASGELQYAMTNPASSNSGFTALLGVTAALAGSADALDAGDVDSSILQDFFKGQILTAGSSGWLAESYLEEQNRLDGLINYESVLMSLNANRNVRDKLYLIYPKEGIVTADYPIMLLNEAKREKFNQLVDFLRSEAFQEKMMRETKRRPVNTQVPLSDEFSDALLVELPFPNSAEVVNDIIFAYLDEQRVPSHAIFVLDNSGSMEGQRLSDLKRALTNLTGTDTSVTGQFARFSERERITMIPFNNSVIRIDSFEVNDATSDSLVMTQIRNYANALNADGGTAIYSALERAYEVAAEAQAQDPNRYYSIVLMSDGENVDGSSLNQFTRFYRNLPDDVKQIRTFPVLFGNANEEEMESLAATTRGRVFDSRSASLSQVFKQIRGYQ